MGLVLEAHEAHPRARCPLHGGLRPFKAMAAGIFSAMAALIEANALRSGERLLDEDAGYR